MHLYRVVMVTHMLIHGLLHGLLMLMHGLLMGLPGQVVQVGGVVRIVRILGCPMQISQSDNRKNN